MIFIAVYVKIHSIFVSYGAAGGGQPTPGTQPFMRDHGDFRYLSAEYPYERRANLSESVKKVSDVAKAAEKPVRENTREEMEAYLLEKARGYAKMDTAELFAVHVLRNYSPEQQAKLGSDAVEAAYFLLRSRLG